MKKILLDKSIVGPWTTQRLGCGWFPDAVAAIGLAEVTPEGPVLVAGVLFSDYNQASIQMHVAAEPGARWMTKAYLGFCFHYAFTQAKVNKVLGYVGSGNVAAQRFDEHIGFRKEAVIQGAHPDGDLIIYSMTKEQCPWLKIQLSPEALYGQE